MVTAEVDIKGFNRFVEGLQLALYGTGQDGDLHQLLRQQGGLLALEISGQIGYRNRERGVRRVEKDLRAEIRPGPEQIFPGAQRGGGNGTTWLYAGPAYLVGVRNEDFQPDMVEAAILKTYYASKKSPGRGPAWSTKGKHGRQSVQMLNRMVVKRERFNAVLKQISGKIGQIKATFAYAAKQLGVGRIPQWISVHFPNVSGAGKAIFSDRLNSKEHPVLEFGSRAAGVVSNPRVQTGIHKAVHIREQKIIAATRNILAGYTRDWNTGRVFRRNAGRDALKQLAANEALYQSFSE